MLGCVVLPQFSKWGKSLPHPLPIPPPLPTSHQNTRFTIAPYPFPRQGETEAREHLSKPDTNRVPWRHSFCKKIYNDFLLVYLFCRFVTSILFTLSFSFYFWLKLSNAWLCLFVFINSDLVICNKWDPPSFIFVVICSYKIIISSRSRVARHVYHVGVWTSESQVFDAKNGPFRWGKLKIFSTYYSC